MGPQTPKMPTVTASVPPPDNRHLAVSSLSRNDSLKSERSDKKVSFNNDVGVKHIPRGETKSSNHSTLPTAPKPKTPDEWDGCASVKLQRNNLTTEQLEQEAAKIVNLVDSINCQASPLPKKKHKEFSSRSLDRSQQRNNLSRNGTPNGLNYNRITNPIIRHLKADVNRRENNYRRKEFNSDSDSDRYRSQRHKSVPNLVSASSNGAASRLPNGIDHSVNYKSVDNLLNDKNINIIQAVNQPTGLRSNHHSADNLLDVEQERSNLVGYKSLGNLPSYSDSDSSGRSDQYKRPKVNQLIRRLSEDPDNRYRRSDLSSDIKSPSRAVIAPSRKYRHNNNKPFSYTHLSKSNDISSPKRENKDEMYAQVNKHGLHQRLSMDSDYSAKIIITEDQPEKNSYEEDDAVYETFNVQNNTLKKNRFNDFGMNLSRDNLNSKHNAMNNNINMSSVAVQTDTVSKALNKGRHNKGMAPPPPLGERVYENYRPTRKDLGSPSDLPSANLVRQVNHGFGRFDRSPSPPPRKLYNQSNERHHIPLLSDTSDSEYEYKRRSDPMTKIRNQVLMGERLQEEHDAEEWEEREYERYHRNKPNSNGMRPLTIDEVDALSVEFDQHGDRKLVLSNKSVAEKRSTSLQTSHIHSQKNENNHTERSFSEERSKPVKPLREKTNREEVNKQTTPENNNNKKNNIEKEKAVLEKKEKENEKFFSKGTLRFKGKEKKNKDTIKDKKKKRIKIKFFYDPKPQDKSSEDPLNRYTEYKGDDNRKGPQDKVIVPKTPRSKSHDSRSQSQERNSVDEVSVDPRNYRDSSRERTTLTRPNRNKPTRGLTDKLNYGRSDHSSNESHDGRRRIKSTDSFYEKSDRYKNKIDYSSNTISREERRNKLGYERDNNTVSYGRERRGYSSTDDLDRNQNNNSRYNDDRYNGYNDSSEEAAIRRKTTFLERREAYEKRDNAVKRENSFSPRRSNTADRRDSYNERAVDGPYKSGDYNRNRHGQNNNSSPSDESPTREDKYTSSPDSDEKQERVLRQRKKFLSALMTDGRAKSSNNNITNLPPKKRYNGVSSTLNRSQSSVNQNQPRERYVNGHESDQPSVNSTKHVNKMESSSKKKDVNIVDPNDSIKKSKKKKKKSWPWTFLGLRGNSNKKKKSGPPSSRGSDIGSNFGTNKKGQLQALNNSRPTSRASSHRSSLRNRPSRPSVRASKIRKDAGESKRVWTSKHHDQRETKQWESATLQRPTGGNRSRDKDNRDYRDVSNERKYDRSKDRDVRNTRRISEGSSASSAAASRSNRTPNFKQRYFGDSDTDHRPRTNVNSSDRGAGPGDYRSLPNRTARNTLNKRGGAPRRVAGGGSAGSSLQSSESENDSHQGSRASHVSTGSNRSVYLHATAVADIPVQKEESERSAQRQTRKVTRSFSLAAPWKPKHSREHHYDNDGRGEGGRHPAASKPPRPPRKSSGGGEQVGRSQTLTNKDSKLSGWLKKRKNREGKGI